MYTQPHFRNHYFSGEPQPEATQSSAGTVEQQTEAKTLEKTLDYISS